MNRKKLAGAAIAALVGLGMLGTATPASASQDLVTITITGDSVADRTFEVYQLATYEGVKKDQLTGNSIFDLVTPGALHDKLVTYLRGNDIVPKYTLGVDPMMWVAENWVDNSGLLWYSEQATTSQIRELAIELASDVTGYSLSAPSNLDWVSSDPAEKTANVPPGLYLVVDKSPNGYTNSQPMIIGTSFGVTDVDDVSDGLIAIKGDLVTIDKDITQAIDAVNKKCAAEDPSREGGCKFTGAEKMAEEDELEDSWTANVGDTVDFVIRTNVPHYPVGHAPAPTFKVVDTPSVGLTLNLASFEFRYTTNDTFGGWISAAAVGHVTSGWVTVPDEHINGSEFSIVLNDAAITALGGELVEFRYSAKVKEAAVDTGGTGGDNWYQKDTNLAKVTYTNIWDVDSDGPADQEDETAEDLTYVYTFPFEILKQDLIEKKDALTGALFNLERDNSMELTGGAHFPSGPDEDGVSSWTGLAGNTWYHVTETTQPAGYAEANKEKVSFAFRVVVDLSDEGTAGDPYYQFAPWPGEFDLLANVDPGKPTEDSGLFFLSLNYRSEFEETDNTTPMDALDNHKVSVYNAASVSDMPSTGGQILLIAGIAGVLGLGAMTFGVVGARKRKATSTVA